MDDSGAQRNRAAAGERERQHQLIGEVLADGHAGAEERGHLVARAIRDGLGAQALLAERGYELPASLVLDLNQEVRRRRVLDLEASHSSRENPRRSRMTAELAVGDVGRQAGEERGRAAGRDRAGLEELNRPQRAGPDGDGQLAAVRVRSSCEAWPPPPVAKPWR